MKRKSDERRLKFTKTAIKALPAPERPAGAGHVQVLYYDTETPHLCCLVSSSGARTFTWYRKVAGRPRKVKIGAFPATTVEQARKDAERMNGEVATGGNPADDRAAAREQATLGALFERYRREHLVARGKATKNADSYFRRWLARWRHRRLDAIRATDVQALHGQIAAATSGANANRVCEFLRAMMNKAQYWGLHPGPNPAEHLDKYPETERARYLEPEEVPRFFRALAEEPNETVRDFFLVALFTGQRRSNVQAMRWEHVNLARGTWTIPAEQTKASRAGKVRRDHVVPLSAEALAVLERRKGEAPEGAQWVFPSRRSKKHGHLVEPKSAWRRILERAGLPAGRDGNGLTIHDLRRTMGSWQVAAGAPLTVIGALLGHRSPSTTAIYARMRLDPVRESLSTATAALLEASKAPAERKP